MTYLPTAEMPADGLTKNLTRQQFEHFVSMLNLRDILEEIEQQDKAEKLLKEGSPAYQGIQ